MISNLEILKNIVPVNLGTTGGSVASRSSLKMTHKQHCNYFSPSINIQKLCHQWYCHHVIIIMLSNDIKPKPDTTERVECLVLGGWSHGLRKWMLMVWFFVFFHYFHMLLCFFLMILFNYKNKINKSPMKRVPKPVIPLVLFDLLQCYISICHMSRKGSVDQNQWRISLVSHKNILLEDNLLMKYIYK